MATTEPRSDPPTPAPQDGSAHPRRWPQVAAVVATVGLGIGIVAAVPWLRHSFLLCLHGNFGGLRSYIHGLGARGLALLLGLMLTHALIYFPTELVTATAGFVYGWLPGLAFVTGGWLLSALLSYLLGVLLAGPLLHSFLGPRYRRFERAMQRGGVPLLIGYRLIPVVPFSFMGYAAGAARIRLWRFGWTTVVGFLPLSAAVAYLGSRAQTLSLSSPIVWVAAVALVALVVVGHRLGPGRSG